MKNYLLKKYLCLLLLFGCVSIFAQNFEWALTGVYGDEFHEGLAISYRNESPDTYKRVYGAIDRSGKEAIPFKFKRIDQIYGGFTSGYCIASTDEGNGIIDTKGNFVFGPSMDYEISRKEKYPELFIIENKSKEKAALFRNGVFMTDYEWDYISDSNYPFVSLSTKDESKPRSSINVVTGDFFEGWMNIPHGDYIALCKDGKYLFYTQTGERLPYSSISKSSKGVEVFQDAETGKYGLRRGSTIIQPAKFKATFNSVWYKDRIILKDYDISHANFTDFVFDGDGKQLYCDTLRSVYIRRGKSCMIYSALDTKQEGVIDMNGKEILTFQNCTISEITNDWVYVFDEVNGDKLYSIRSGKIYPTKHSFLKGEVIDYYDGKNKYVLNPKTEKFYGPYTTVGDFSEGLIYVEKGDTKSFITKDGKSYPIPKEWSTFSSSKFTEGVCPVTNDNGVHGYIYNPLGHGGYVYNQQSVDNDKSTINSLYASAEQAFKQKEYGKSKDLYYHIIMADPSETFALNSYAACLYNLGYYEEALSAVQLTFSVDADNTFAKDLYKTIVQAIDNRDNSANQDTDEYTDVIGGTSVWDAIANFGKVLANVSNISAGNYGSGVSNTVQSSRGSSASNRDYLSQYRNWERIAERHYNSITNTGVSVTSKDGSKSGSAGQGMSSSNYTRMKRSYREAQQEMARIRREASKAGVTIPQSRWETNTISY